LQNPISKKKKITKKGWWHGSSSKNACLASLNSNPSTAKKNKQIKLCPGGQAKWHTPAISALRSQAEAGISPVQGLATASKTVSKGQGLGVSQW
jgi:hypothetical protein